MFPEMRRKDRQISREEAMEILSRAEYGVLSSTLPDGQPYAVPFNFAVEGESIYLHCSAAPGTTLKNLAADGRVCFTVVGQTQLMPDKFATLYESCVVFGRAIVAEGETLRRHALELLLKKYSAGYFAAGQDYIEKLFELTAIIEIKIGHVSGKARRPVTPSNLSFLGRD